MPIAASLVVKVAAETADVTRGLSQADAAVTQFASNASRAGEGAARGFATIGTAAGVAGGAIAAGLGAAVNTAASFQQRMSAVAAVSGATGAQLAGLSAKALEFGAATDLAGIDATDAARAMEELAKGGVSVEQMAGAAHGALLLASAGEVSVAEAADTAVRAMNIFNLTGDQVGHVADVMAAAANKSATDVGQLNAAFNQSASVAHGAGLSLEQLTGTLALLAQNGLQGSDAGTSLRNAILRLTAPTKESAALMEQLGINIFDAQGHMRDFADIADNIKSALAGMTDEQRQATLEQLGGQDAIRVLNVLYKEGGDGIRQWSKAVDDGGSAARIGAERNANLRGSLDQLKASAQTAAIVFGSQLAPDIDALAKKLTEAVTWFSNLDPAVQRNIGHAAELAAGLGLLTFATSKVVGEVRNLSGAISDVIGWFAKKQAAKAALEGANKSLATSVGGTNTALKGLVLTLGESVIVIGGTALVMRGLLELVAQYGQRVGDNTAATQYLTREQQAQAIALAAVGKGNEDLVRIYTSSAEAQDFLTGKTQSGTQAWNDYVARLNAAGENFNQLQPILIATGVASGAVAAAFAQATVSGRGLSDAATALAVSMVAADTALVGHTQAAYGAGVATGAFAASSYDLATALGQLQAATGPLSGQYNILQQRIDALQEKQKEGIALTQQEQTELNTLREAQNRLGDDMGILAAQERAHILAMVGLNTEFGNNTTGADALSQASLNLGQQMGTSAVQAGLLAQGINTGTTSLDGHTGAAERNRTATLDNQNAMQTATAAGAGFSAGLGALKWATDAAASAHVTAKTRAQEYREALLNVPPAVTTLVTTPGLPDGTVMVNDLTGAIYDVPRSFTVTAYVDISGALANIQRLRDAMPSSPAKTGPFRTLPDWGATLASFAPAVDSALGQLGRLAGAMGLPDVAGPHLTPALAGGVAVPAAPPATGGGHTSTTVVNFNDSTIYGLPSFETAVRSAMASAERRGG